MKNYLLAGVDDAISLPRRVARISAGYVLQTLRIETLRGQPGVRRRLIAASDDVSFGLDVARSSDRV